MDVSRSYDAHLVPLSEIDDRLARLRKALREHDLDGALLLQNVDVFYFTGCMQNGILFVPAGGDPLFCVRRSFERAAAESPIAGIVRLNSVQDLPSIIAAHHGNRLRRVGMELDTVPAAMYRRFSRLFSEATISDVSKPIRKIRARKSPFEIDLLKRAGELGRMLYAEVPGFLADGGTEMDVAARMTEFAMKHGHLDLLRSRAFNSEMFTWHVICGESGGVTGHLDAPFSGRGIGPAFPAGAGFKTIEKGEPVLIDFGTCIDGYMADQTRMFAVAQRPESLFMEAYEALQAIEAKILERTAPGIGCEELYRLGIEVAGELKFEDAFLGPVGQKIRFLGHGIGLEVDEFPFLAEGHGYPLEEGNVFALELKMVYPGKGAVGFENTVTVIADGYEKITTADERFILVPEDL